jgi:hypothetical protein
MWMAGDGHNVAGRGFLYFQSFQTKIGH